MATYQADILWTRGDQDFLSNRYSRRHVIRFDGGIEVPGSSSPHVVPVPLSDPAAVDPEEAFVASIASCHMLWFLSIAAKRKYCVDRYTDSRRGRDGEEFRRQGVRRTRDAASGGRVFRRPHSGPGRAPRAPSSGARGMLHRQFGPDGNSLRARARRDRRSGAASISLPTHASRASRRKRVMRAICVNASSNSALWSRSTRRANSRRMPARS